MSIENPLVIDLPSGLSPESGKSLREQVYYLSPEIKAVSLAGTVLTVQISSDLPDGESLRQRIVDLAAAAVASFRRVRTTMLFELKGTGTCSDDPFPELLRKRNVRRHAPGIFTFEGDFLRLMCALDGYFRAYALEIHAVEQAYPPTVLTRSMAKSGYLGNFPHHALLVAGVKRAAESVRQETKPSGAPAADDLADPQQMLAPTVCYRCFEAMIGEKIGDSAIFTGTAHCNRNEGFIDDNLTRLQSFLMREIIFFGATDEVGELRRQILEHARAAIEDWGLTARAVTASDPFFMSANQGKRGYQTLMQLKYEMQLALPHDGTWLSCMSFNDHQGSLVGPYDIQAERGGALTSGCVGYGLERLAYAILCQHGIDRESWPRRLRRIIDDFA